MKKFIAILSFICSVLLLSAQTRQVVSGQAVIDSFRKEMAQTQNVMLCLVLATQLRFYYFLFNTNMDSTLSYSKLVLQLAQKLDYKIDEAHAFDLVADVINYQHNESTLTTFFKGIKIAEETAAENNIFPKKYLNKMLYWKTGFTKIIMS